jgi:hypothetical protein
MKFKSWIAETLNFDSPQRAGMQTHPLVTGATVGLEIELMTLSIPYKEFTPLMLARALWDADDYKFDVQQRMRLNAESEYDDDEDLDMRDLINWVTMNKKEAYDYFKQHLESGQLNLGKTSTDWKDEVVKYWSKHFMKAIEAGGFKAFYGAQSTKDSWAVGDDGHDTMYHIPILEMRSSVIPYAALPNLQKALTAIAEVIKNNPEDLMVQNNTGIHIHVGNARTGDLNAKGWRGDHMDMFSRLAAATHTDEDSIWDTMSKHDRDFSQFAMLNRQQDFEQTRSGYGSAHNDIINQLNNLRYKKEPTITVSNKDLWNRVKPDRKSGTSVVSEHPTVEYRHFTSQVLMEADGVEKIMAWIKYFVDNAASQVNKNRIKFENDEERIILTKLPKDMVRIDFQDKGSKARIPQPGMPRDALMATPKSGVRDTDQGFKHWWDRLTWQQKAQYRKDKGRPPLV